MLKLLLHYTTLLDNLSVSDLNDAYKYLSAVYLLQVQAQSLIDIMVKAASAWASRLRVTWMLVIS